MIIGLFFHCIKIDFDQLFEKIVNLKIIDIFRTLILQTIHIAKKKYHYDFIYPASLMKHKNHNLLIEVLINLSKKFVSKVLLTLNDKEKIKIRYY